MFRIENLNPQNFKNIPDPCKCCLYWLTSGSLEKKASKMERKKKKREWLDKLTTQFGNCGFLAFVDGDPIGFAHFAPKKFFPRVKDYDSGPPSEDSVFLACLYIAEKEERGKGLGTAMLNRLIVELREKGIKGVETLARKSSQNNPSGPIELYLKAGFKIKTDGKDFPLMRLELQKTTDKPIFE